MTGNDTNIVISDHAVERYIERFSNGLACITNKVEQKKRAEEEIKRLFCESAYISDHELSILFRHRDLEIDMLVKYKRLITLFATRKHSNGKRH